MPKKPRDKWDKLDILLKPAGGIMAAVLIAGIGFFGSGYLEKRQDKEMRTRLYTELISKREQSESVLRKDMFTKIIDKFLSSDTSGLEGKVLNLELLVYNFHESLNLKPLFNHVIRELPESLDPKSNDFLKRLRRVAGEIKNKQAAVLGDHGIFQDIEFKCPNAFMSLPDSVEVLPPIFRKGFCLELDSIVRYFIVEILEIDSGSREIEINLEIITPIGERAILWITDTVCSDTSENIFDLDYKALSGLLEDSLHSNDLVSIIMEEYITSMTEFVDPFADPIEASPLASKPPPEKQKPDPKDALDMEDNHFGVDFFDFPMIDNTRLGQKDHRLAIVLTRWQPDPENEDSITAIEMKAICFPGSYASLKDRPFYDDIVNKLMPEKDD
ncbi:MAG: hypothetical protein GY841_03695 [FCB group bacterium]|nr:hypothetical protein [FCB group bacterium]